MPTDPRSDSDCVACPDCDTCSDYCDCQPFTDPDRAPKSELDDSAIIGNAIGHAVADAIVLAELDRFGVAFRYPDTYTDAGTDPHTFPFPVWDVAEPPRRNP